MVRITHSLNVSITKTYFNKVSTRNNKLILDDIKFVGQTVSELQNSFREYGLLGRKKADIQTLNLAYKDAYDHYKSNFRFNPNNIDTYVEQLPHETSSAFDKASQEVEWS